MLAGMAGSELTAGADGCRSGWICVVQSERTGVPTAALYTSATDFLFQQPKPAVLAIDIVIGLTGRGPRACDKEARRLLRAPRASSVFPAPVRRAVEAESREEASAITERADGRRVNVLSWAISSKIRAVDALMTPALQPRVSEVHPEVSFAALNQGAAIVHSKKRRAGRQECRRLVDEAFGPNAFDRIRDQFLGREVASDDILDAFAALWTARRIVAGTYKTLSDDPPRGERRLAMEIAV